MCRSDDSVVVGSAEGAAVLHGCPLCAAARDTRGMLENLVTECDGVRQWDRLRVGNCYLEVLPQPQTFEKINFHLEMLPDPAPVLVTWLPGPPSWDREQLEATAEEMGAHGIAALQLAAECDCTDDTPFNELMTRHSGMQLYELDGQAVNMDEDVLTMLNRVEGYDWDSEKDWPQPVLRLYYIHLLSPRCCCAGALEIGHS